MKIIELELLTSNLEMQLSFYRDVLGLPILESGMQHLSIQIGSSLLKFTMSPGFSGHYHVAFDVPENQLRQAKSWLESRVALIADLDKIVVFGPGEWNAHQVYFSDPQGNILELIARHELTNANQSKFSSNNFLNISEIGLACDDVPSLVQWLEENLNLEIYKSFSNTFASVGNANGLLILVQNAREWFPSTGVFATPQPTTIVIKSDQTQTLKLPDLPYKIETRTP